MIDRFRISVICVLTASVPILPPAAGADDWPGWRGPHRDGKSAETGLLREWPEGGPPLARTLSGLGGGFSSVAVAAGKIFTMGDLGESQFVVALDQQDGKLLWKTRIGPAWPDQFLGPRSTPSFDPEDGGRVFALGTEGDLVGLEAATGKEVWRRSLPGDFGGFVMKAKGTYDWKWSESPLVDGDRLIVTPGAADAQMVALDKKTGREVWRAAVPELGTEGRDGAGYSSAVVSRAAGVRQYVQLVGRGVIGLEAATGRFLWGYNRVANLVANIPTPLVDGDRVVVATGYPNGGGVGLRIGRQEDKLVAEELWYHDSTTLQNHHGQMILHDGHVYLGHGLNRGLPVCVEVATGKFAWGPTRNAGRNSAALAYADGHLYFRYQSGRMLLVEATPEGYREKGSLVIPGVVYPSWSQPVISGGHLYLREQDKLYVYDVRARG